MICPICNKKMDCMTPQHVKTHGLTMQEFRQKYKTVEMSNFIRPKGSNTLSISKPWMVTGRVIK